jgi:glyoxylase I family protein
MVTIQRFRHVAIVVEDLEAMIAFYTSVFGLKVIQRYETAAEDFRRGVGLPGARASAAHLQVPNSPVQIEMFQYADSPTSDPRRSRADVPGYRHIAFVVESLDQACARLRDEGLEFFSEPITLRLPGSSAGTRFVYFTDPEGNIVELNELPPGE